MKLKHKIITALFIAGFITAISAQSKSDDIPVGDLPPEVAAVIEQYAQALKSSATIEEAAIVFAPIAGGSLISSEGILTSNTKQFGLKKDFNNIKHYAYPLKFTRVNKTQSNGEGYGATKLAGTKYKVWIAKDDPVKGMPAPVSIIVPAEGTPKIVNVGSF